jgi:serine/threonine protein phosphatase PrpC
MIEKPRRRSYTKKNTKRLSLSKHRSKKVNKPSVSKQKFNKHKVSNNIYSTDNISDNIVKKSSLVNSPKSHEYEDRVSKYIDPDGKFVMIGLFDSHSGSYSSVKLSQDKGGLLDYIATMLKTKQPSNKLFNDAFINFDNLYLSKTESGATTTIIYLSKHNVYIANVGDSPAYSISPSASSLNIDINQLSVEHDYFNLKERKRVYDMSKDKNVWEDQRVHGSIQSARGMGDFEIKEQEPGVFINNPSIHKLDNKQLKKIKYLMITSDGVTDPFTEKYEEKNILNGYPSITDKQMLKNSLRNFKSIINIDTDPNNIIKSTVELVKKKVKGDYQDDISIIIMDVKEILKCLI